ncbi:MAG: DUF5343 domain-containing protein [Chloroflexi bacterium]|nr:DUF5343 domain-containing protein [Chloroflexota bacterium]
MTNDGSRKRLPPYVSYRTFTNCIDGMQQRGVPARFDRSYWEDMLSGSTGTQLLAALRFMNLIDVNGRTMPQLKPLVSAKGDQRAERLNEIASECYSFVLKGSLDLQNATRGQLEEAFKDSFQLTDDVNRKCIKFFIALANDAGITLSTHITKKIRTAYSRTGTKAIARKTNGTRVVAKKTAVRTNRNSKTPQILEEIPGGTPWDKELLSKFPTFDPNWPDEVKLKWFAAFDELLRRGLTKGEK